MEKKPVVDLFGLFLYICIMAYKPEEIQEIFNKILIKISIEGKAIRNILKETGMPSNETFFKWLDEDEAKSKQYARACEQRADYIFEEILEIADKQDSDVIEIDGNIVTNHNVINRSRLQVDARKWALSKMNPKKYGDKLDITSDNTRLNIPLIPDIGNR